MLLLLPDLNSAAIALIPEYLKLKFCFYVFFLQLPFFLSSPQLHTNGILNSAYNYRNLVNYRKHLPNRHDSLHRKMLQTDDLLQMQFQKRFAFRIFPTIFLDASWHFLLILN